MLGRCGGHRPSVGEAGALIRSLGGAEPFFTQGVKIYLDGCVEVIDLPEKGLVTEYVTCSGKDPGGVRAPLIDAPEGAAIMWDKDDAYEEGVGWYFPPFIEM